MVKLIQRFSGNLIYHVLYLKTPDNLQTNFATKCALKSITLHAVSKQSDSTLTILVIRFNMFSP